MKKVDSGIEKEIDNLGRVVLPMNYRKRLGLDKNPRVRLYVSNDNICITSADGICVICRERNACDSRLKICTDCIKRVKALPE